MKCILLCSKFNTKINQSNDTFPEPLVCINDKYLIEELIDDLEKKNQIDEFIVVSNHFFIEYYRNWINNLNNKIVLIDDGSTSADNNLTVLEDILLAIEKANINDDILVLNGESILKIKSSINKFLFFSKEKNGNCVMNYCIDNTLQNQIPNSMLDINYVNQEKTSRNSDDKSNIDTQSIYFLKKEFLTKFKRMIDSNHNIFEREEFLVSLSKISELYFYKVPEVDEDLKINSINNTVQVKESRILWCDIVKFICTFFVIVAHLKISSGSTFILNFYRPFFLAAFFFVSGYVYKNKLSFWQLIKRKSLTLLIPILAIGIIDFIIERIVNWEHEKLTIEIINLFLQIREKGDKLWFVACLFVAFIPFYFILKFKSNKIKIIISTIIGIIGISWSIYFPNNIFPWGSNAVPWHIPTAFVACMFMVYAYVIKNSFDFINMITSKNKVVIVFLSLLVVYIGLLFINYYCINNDGIGINYYGKSISWYLLLTWVSIFFVIFMAKLIRPFYLLSYIGSHSLVYFMFQSKVYTFVELILKKINLFDFLISNSFIQTVSIISEAFIVCLILIIPAYCVDHYFPFIVGKWYKSKKNNQ